MVELPEFHSGMINYKRAWNSPTVYNNVHESIYRSWHILEVVKGMLERGDLSPRQMLEWINVMGAVTYDGNLEESNGEIEYKALPIKQPPPEPDHSITPTTIHGNYPPRERDTPHEKES